MKRREWSNLKFSQNFSFRAYNTFVFWYMVIPFGPHSISTQWGVQRLCNLFILWNQTMKVWPSSRAMEKGHLPWSDIMVHGVNQPSITLCYIHTITVSYNPDHLIWKYWTLKILETHDTTRKTFPNLVNCSQVCVLPIALCRGDTSLKWWPMHVVSQGWRFWICII